MTATPEKPGLLDGQLDRATDQEYAAISPMAVVGLVLGILGIAALLAPPLVAMPAIGFILSLIALRRIRRSEGVLAGRGFAVAGIVIGLGLTILGGATHGIAWYRQQTTLSDLRSRAFQIADDLAAGRYEKAYQMMPSEWRAQQAAGVKEFRNRIGPLFEGAGPLVSRRLMSLQPLPVEEKAKNGKTVEQHFVAPAEMQVDLQHRILAVTLWFGQDPDGRWDLIGVAAEETLESQEKYPSQTSPAPVHGPYMRQQGHED
jgi:hypothetical protein